MIFNYDIVSFLAIGAAWQAITLASRRKVQKPACISPHIL